LLNMKTKKVGNSLTHPDRRRIARAALLGLADDREGARDEVACDQGHRALGCDRVERLLGGLDRRQPVTTPPAAAADPATAGSACRSGRDT